MSYPAVMDDRSLLCRLFDIAVRLDSRHRHLAGAPSADAFCAWVCTYIRYSLCLCTPNLVKDGELPCCTARWELALYRFLALALNTGSLFRSHPYLDLYYCKNRLGHSRSSHKATAVNFFRHQNFITLQQIRRAASYFNVNLRVTKRTTSEVSRSYEIKSEYI